MKIAIFSDNFYPEISGISDSIILLAEELQKRGHEIHFFAPRYSRANFRTANLDDEELFLGKNIHIHRLWSLPFFGSPSRQARLVIPSGICAWKFRKAGFDLVYTQDPFGVGLEGLFMAKIFGTPLIGTNHTPIEEFVKYVPFVGNLIKKMSRHYFVWYYNRCRFVSAPYQGLLDDMQKIGLKKENKAISNPIDLKNFVPVSAEKKKALKEKYTFPQATILYAGRLAEEKHVDVIIHAMSEVAKVIPDALLVITGHGNMEDKLRELAKKLDLDKKIKFFGRVDDQRHIEFYQASEIFVIMSTAETQSLSLMKAMAVGMPVIAADARALPVYVGRDGSRGFVVRVGAEKELAEKIIWILQNSEERDKMGQRGTEFASKFSAENVVQEWENIFRKTVNESLPQKNFKLSFVIPAYNEEKYLGDCLKSILLEIKDKKFDVEIIVANNASTDRTREIALSFPGVKVVDEPHKGLTWARQAGYLASEGELIANIDADTLLPKGWLKNVFDEFSKNENLVALSGPHVYYDLTKIDRFFVRIFYYFGYLTYLINYYLLDKSAMLQGGNFIVKRSAMEKIGGYTLNFNFYEDTDIASRIYKQGNVKFTFNLPIFASGRRLRKEGLIKSGWKYAINYFWVIFFKKPLNEGYRTIR